MEMPRFNSLSEQVAASVREKIRHGIWSGAFPGRDKLVREFGVSGKTIETALRQLQNEGWLVSQGPGRRRIIVPRADHKGSPLKIAILTFEPIALSEGYTIQVQQRLAKAGHSAFFAAKSLTELKHSVDKLAAFVRKTKADAWVIEAGSREMLEWFIERDIPVFALFGRRRGLSIPGAGPDKVPAYLAVTRRLLELGHKRIVLLTGKPRRLPTPGVTEAAFLKELVSHGIGTSGYNLPDWEESAQGFNDCLHKLFHITPPTALIVDETHFFLAALQFCANQGLRVPLDVSLISTDDNPSFAWFVPEVAQIRWDRQSVIRQTERWAANVSRGKSDTRQTFTKAEFVEGGTIGPAPKA